jgi:hypothetical protein
MRLHSSQTGGKDHNSSGEMEEVLEFYPSLKGLRLLVFMAGVVQGLIRLDLKLPGLLED